MAQITGAQCRMARSGLQLGVRDIAAKASVSPNTIARLERGEQLQTGTLEKIQRALEAAGVEFTNADAPGVRLRSASISAAQDQEHAEDKAEYEASVRKARRRQRARK